MLLLQEPQRSSPVPVVSAEERRDGLLNDLLEEQVWQDPVLMEDVRFQQILVAGHSRCHILYQLDIVVHAVPSR